MKLSKRGAKLIANFEGFRARPYNDAAGHCTVGYGHLIHYGGCTAADYRKWGSLSVEEGLNLLQRDADRFERAVTRLVRVPLNQNQFDALVSFAFNVGEDALENSTLRRKLNARDYQGAANELLKWNKAGGKPLYGLTRRRRAERKLFLSDEGSYDDLTKTERAWVNKLFHHRKGMRRSRKGGPTYLKHLGWARFFKARLKGRTNELQKLIKREGVNRLKRGTRLRIIREIINDGKRTS